jgi:hypothetical protein
MGRLTNDTLLPSYQQSAELAGHPPLRPSVAINRGASEQLQLAAFATLQVPPLGHLQGATHDALCYLPQQHEIPQQQQQDYHPSPTAVETRFNTFESPQGDPAQQNLDSLNDFLFLSDLAPNPWLDQVPDSYDTGLNDQQPSSNGQEDWDAAPGTPDLDDFIHSMQDWDAVLGTPDLDDFLDSMQDSPSSSQSSISSKPHLTPLAMGSSSGDTSSQTTPLSGTSPATNTSSNRSRRSGPPYACPNPTCSKIYPTRARLT